MFGDCKGHTGQGAPFLAVFFRGSPSREVGSVRTE